ncbi:MAG: GAF domain-containing protein, partial [bacterium]
MDESAFLTNFQPFIAAESSEAEVRLPKDDLKTLLVIATKYRTLHDVGKLVASEMETDALLRLAMDKVIEVTHAQRGFIALVEDKNRFDFKVARHLEKSDIDKPRFQVSRSIIEKVMATGETICLRDAMADATFGGAESVTRLQLLSVLCTPIKIADRVAGVIYVDNANVKQLFDDTVVGLLTAFSEQIAIALKNAYVFSDLKKSHQQLANELRNQYRFEAIIGSGPAMTKILDLVSKVADTEATVLIQGENGTGKKLIAEALHYN